MNEFRIVKPAPKKFDYKAGWLGGWIICEGDHVIAVTQQEMYAKAICNCLNICFALFSHLPIKMASAYTDAKN